MIVFIHDSSYDKKIIKREQQGHNPSHKTRAMPYNFPKGLHSLQSAYLL